mmetsp:Transcript_22435/g.57094  ORF Transcript_22435/g.57094 Transcript_22435/m.57094 type:complete len:229 (+) Transcript_22435:2470-3156(+)
MTCLYWKCMTAQAVQPTPQPPPRPVSPSQSLTWRASRCSFQLPMYNQRPTHRWLWRGRHVIRYRGWGPTCSGSRLRGEWQALISGILAAMCQAMLRAYSVTSGREVACQVPAQPPWMWCWHPLRQQPPPTPQPPAVPPTVGTTAAVGALPRWHLPIKCACQGLCATSRAAPSLTARQTAQPPAYSRGPSCWILYCLGWQRTARGGCGACAAGLTGMVPSQTRLAPRQL